MLITDMSENEKLNFFVIRKAMMPLCFKEIKSLLFNYWKNKKAQNTLILFRE